MNLACDETINRGSLFILSSTANHHNFHHINSQLQACGGTNLLREEIKAKFMCCSAAAPNMVSSKGLK